MHEATEARWAERVVGWRASGQTARAYAATQGGFSAGGLRHWAYRLKKSGALPPAETARSAKVQLVRVEARPATATFAEAEPGRALIIEVGQARIHVPPAFDAATLRAVLDALAPGGRR
jgi:hypothetical protein